MSSTPTLDLAYIPPPDFDNGHMYDENGQMRKMTKLESLKFEMDYLGSSDDPYDRKEYDQFCLKYRDEYEKVHGCYPW